LTENARLQTIKRWFGRENEKNLLNADAFTRLYEETHLIVFRYLYGLSGGPLEEAEDLTAETYTRAWKTCQHINSDQQATLGWLLRIARNLAIDLSRRRKVRNTDEGAAVELLADPDLTPEMDIITREQITILWHMLDTLSEEVREILVLRYILGWQVKQISQYLGINENNVSVTIHRTLKSLQRDWPQSQEKDYE